MRAQVQQGTLEDLNGGPTGVTTTYKSRATQTNNRADDYSQELLSAYCMSALL